MAQSDKKKRNAAAAAQAEPQAAEQEYDAAAVDEVMRKYDRDSNVRIWTGWQKWTVYGILAALLALRADRAPAERERCAGALRDLLAACRRFPEHVPHADELQALFDRNELLACYFS